MYLTRSSGCKGQMKALARYDDLLCTFQAQLVVTSLIPVAHCAVVSEDLGVPQWPQHRVIEGRGPV
jgi:hypothetical protein